MLPKLQEKVQCVRRERKLNFDNKITEILNFFCNSGDRSRRTWKPNVQEKRLFSYVLDRHIRVEVTTHTLRCLDKAGGIDEYLLKTPYHKMGTEMGLYWKSRIETMYEELGKREVVFFSPEDEARFEQRFKDLKVAERTARRDPRRQMSGWSDKQKQIEEGQVEDRLMDEEAAPEQWDANS
ncbi:hypothetical protein RGQ29_006994 [Quercus rubra]|uniref:Large ribosomal subunit protein bL28m n=1 Tax=Quercus rubra TaxID=3512 RepID=A0AAN7E8E3_QUERU|nr:hypothetical protein RGQ29_006994 [Quercus rubra]